MSIYSYIGLIGGICSLAGYVPYIYKLLKGEAEAPERASWLVWTLSNILILLSYWEIGARTTIWVPLAYFIGSAAITIVAFFRGRTGWGSLDQLALIVAIISSIRWVLFDDPFIALILNLAIGLIAYLPNIWKLAKRQRVREEFEIEVWTLFFLGAIFNLIAISPWVPFVAALPIAVFIMNGITFSLVLRNALAKEMDAVDIDTDQD